MSNNFTVTPDIFSSFSPFCPSLFASNQTCPLISYVLLFWLLFPLLLSLLFPLLSSFLSPLLLLLLSSSFPSSEGLSPLLSSEVPAFIVNFTVFEIIVSDSPVVTDTAI